MGLSKAATIFATRSTTNVHASNIKRNMIHHPRVCLGLLGNHLDEVFSRLQDGCFLAASTPLIVVSALSWPVPHCTPFAELPVA